MPNLFAVVITTFNRPARLKRCLDSIPDTPGVEIVVSSMGTMPGISRPGVRVVHYDDDSGVNELWLRGLYATDAPFVLILHDDDWLNPGAVRWIRNTAVPIMKNPDCGLVCWNGEEVTDDGRRVKHRYLNEEAEGLMASGPVMDALMTPGGGPISPVLGLFRREEAICALKEADDELTFPECNPRQGMMLGNEILLYGRTLEKYSHIYHTDQFLTCFGSWEGSETKTYENSGRFADYIKGYDKAREYVRKVRGSCYRPHTRLIWVYNPFMPTEVESLRRHEFAFSTWEPMFNSGDVIPCPVTSGIRYSNTVLGDTRSIPFLRDLIDAGCRHACYEDIVAYSNLDVCVVPDLPTIVIDRFSDDYNMNAAFAPRRTTVQKITQPVSNIEDIPRDPGMDTVFFDPDWWTKNRALFPDFVVACEGWDLIYRRAIAESNPDSVVMIDNLIYHEYHSPEWIQPGFRRTNPGQRHNLRLVKNYLMQRGQLQKFKSLLNAEDIDILDCV